MKPLIIGVGGAHSGAGKTLYVSLLLRRLRGWGAIKYTKTGLYSSVTDDREILLTEDKDTRRMLDSGAEEVLWVQSPPSELGEVLPLAIERLSHLGGIIVEGNSAIEFLCPNIILFIFGSDIKRAKGSAAGILSKADVVVVSDNGTSPDLPREARVFGKSPEDTEKLLTYIAEMVEKKDTVRSLLRDSSVGGRISCSLARKIAEDLKLPYREIGRTADELGIKVTACELGCF